MQLNALIPELSVSDIKKSLDFYITILQGKMEYERSENKFALVSISNVQIMLEEVNGCWETGRLEYPFGRGINFQIQVADVEVLYKRIIKAQYPVKITLQDNWYRAKDVLLGQKEFLVMDPDGYLLRFAQPLGESFSLRK